MTMRAAAGGSPTWLRALTVIVAAVFAVAVAGVLVLLVIAVAAGGSSGISFSITELVNGWFGKPRRNDFWGLIWHDLGILVLGLALFAAAVGIILFLADRAPKRGRDVVQLLAFVAPAMVLLSVGLVYPAIRTTVLAFFNRNGSQFVGFDNFVWMFTQPDILGVLGNTLLWVALVPITSTAIGLAYAVFIDRAYGERVLKSLVFMPMAISFVGAGIIWRFMYDAKAAGYPQIGLLNQVVVWFGGEPQQWLINSPWNNLFLMFVMIWIQTGFAMVLFSAAIKGVPTERLEAARLDGANAWQTFWNVTMPEIRPTLVVVMTTITIATLKVFDIVRAMTGGNFGTSIIANEMYTQTFERGEQGYGSALAVVLFVMVLPIVIYNIRVMRAQKEIR